MSNVIGQALIEVVASGQNFGKSVDSETKKGLSAAEASASQSGDKIGRNLKGKFSSAFSGIGTVAKVGLTAGLGAGIAGLGYVFKTGIGEVSDYQKGLAQLQQGLKTTHGAAGLSAQGMENLASKIQDYSGQTDDSVVAAEQLLVTFTNIRNEAGKGNDVFTQTTKVAADMAARLGGDASTSAIQLGKALNDPIKGVGALSRVGVSFDEGQKKQIATMVKAGNTMGAQKIILKELNKEFGGSAKAVGETLPGMIERGKRHFEDFAQNLVTKMVPALMTLGNFIAKNIIPVIQLLVTQAFARVQQVLPILIALITQHLVPAFLMVWGFVQKNLLPIFQAVAQFIVGTLAPALAKILGAALDGLRAAFHQISATVQQHRAQLVALGNVVRTVAEFIVKFLVPVLSVVLKTAFRVLGFAISAVITIIAGLVSTIRGIINISAAVIGWLQGHWKLILAILTGPIGLAVLFISTHFSQIVGFVKGMPGRIASAASGMWDGIKNAFRGAINYIIDAWNGLQFTIPGVHVGPVKFGGFTLGTPDIPRLATGGALNGLALAGEFGPEIVAGSGRVISRTETQKMLGHRVTIERGAFQVIIQGPADRDMVQEALNSWETGFVQNLRRRGLVGA